MKWLTVSRWPQQADELRHAVASSVARDGIVVYPTETFYGLGVNVTSTSAVARLFELKGRDPSSALPVIADCLDSARAVAVFNSRARQVASAMWPGPLTLVLPARTSVACDLLGDRETIAIRVSSHPIARAVALAAGGAITSTSANLSGGPPARSAEAVREALGSRLGSDDLVIDAGTTPGGLPSTIADLTSEVPTLIRAGAVPWDRVLEFVR